MLVTLVLSTLAAGRAAAEVGEGAPALVTVTRHGGLCVSGSECRSVLRITDSSIVAAGYVTRPLARAERAALLTAIARLDLAALRRHPFTGTCPTASDGTESVYRFRGFAYPLAACTYDLRGVAAVQLTERLLSTLRPR